MYVHYWQSVTTKPQLSFGENSDFFMHKNSSECCWLIPTWESYEQACEMED